jgi:diketogulonate reductase-like aldo/keto reductase
MPLLGLGVYQSAPGRETEQAVLWALEAGYRHIDTAAAYRNEANVGRALKASGLKRQDVFVTTKLRNDDQGADTALRAFDGSLHALGVDYIDLYLLHWPVPGKRLQSWKVLERVFQEGRCRALGVSNYMEHHLKELLDHTALVPAVNQVEFSPFLYLRDLHTFCQKKQIQLEAYGPLTQGQKLQHPKVTAMARSHHKTPAQVLLRWAIQHSVVVIPKSVKKERIEENAQIFDFSLSGPDMNTLDGLNENFRTCWDPTQEP